MKKNFVRLLVLPVYGCIILFSTALIGGCGGASSTNTPNTNVTSTTVSVTTSTLAATTTTVPSVTTTTLPPTPATVVACPSSGTTNVTIQDFSFTPTPVTISVNGIVKWTNNGSSIHTVTSGSTPTSDGKFNSGNLATGSTVCVIFQSAGSYPYFCSPHPFMTGSVTVQ